MRNFIAFQEFVPHEQTNDERCIWCKLCTPRNKAHIISKKLTVSSHAVAVLKFTVCQKCNSKCGELEQWILRYSPLTWVRFLCYLDSNKNAECITVPSYFYANNLGEWLVYNIEAGGRKAIPSQVLLLREGSIKMFSQKPKNTHKSRGTQGRSLSARQENRRRQSRQQERNPNHSRRNTCRSWKNPQYRHSTP